MPLFHPAGLKSADYLNPSHLLSPGYHPEEERGRGEGGGRVGGREGGRERGREGGREGRRRVCVREREGRKDRE